MNLLVFGGTRFAGRFLTERAVARGHRVTLVHRGVTAAASDPLPAEVENVSFDRSSTDPVPLAGRAFDAVVDFSGYVPRAVSAAARATVAARSYVFVSSISAYPSAAAPPLDEDAAVSGPPFPPTEDIDAATYGPLKVACERAVLEVFGARAAIVRPGYIVGPRDPTDRFPSLVRRAAAGGEMLVAADPDAWLQFVDARDLAIFLLDLAERAVGGVFDAVHPLHTARLADVLALARDQAGADTRFTFVDHGWLRARLGAEIERAFPLWEAAKDGYHEVRGARAASAGLPSRPIADTVAAVLAWAAAHPHPEPHGLPLEEERRALDAWRHRADGY